MYISPKLVKGFQKLIIADLTEEQILFLSTVVDHGNVPSLVHKYFFAGAYERGSHENKVRWEKINQMEKSGFIERSYVPNPSGSGLTIEKYDYHPDLGEHLYSKYSSILFPDTQKNGYQHILSLPFEQAGEALFHKTFQPAKNLTLNATSRYFLTVNTKRGQAFLEIKQIS